MKIRLRHKVIGLAVVSALIPVLVFTYMILSQQEQVVERFDQDLDALVDKDLTDALQNVTSLCSTVNSLIEKEVNASLRVAVKYIQDLGPTKLSSKSVLWRAENEWDKRREDVVLREIVFGNTPLRQNFRKDVKSNVVDDVAGLVGCTVSVFQKMNERGDMLRVATTLERDDGGRDIGQFLRAESEEHDPEHTIAKILKGEVVYSTVYYTDEWFIFAAAPLKDSETGEVIGMVRTAISQNSFRPLHDALAQVFLGERGFVWVLQGKNRSGEGQANFIYPERTDGDY